MKHLKLICCLLCVGILSTSCFEDQDDNLIIASDINDFVWKGMNAYYLYKEEIPDLANDRFDSNEAYGAYLSAFSTPENLFQSLLFDPNNVDEFSFLISDYIAWEQALSGQSISNGMEYGLVFSPGSSSNVFGYVRYVLPDSNAEMAGIQRGHIFTSVNGESLYYNSSSDNNLNLLNLSAFDIDIASYEDNGTEEFEDDIITPGTEFVSLATEPYQENPIYYHDVLNASGSNVGYIVYNRFSGSDNYDSELNAVFGEFQAANVSELVIDLRYNPGGFVRTATWLASMVTGQHTNETFISEQWNPEIQTVLEADAPESLLNPFTDEMIKTNSDGNIVFQESINHLNLNRVYILTTGSTASASELIINGLDPYIDVVHIGTTTRGKYQASLTLYDSPTFSKTEINPNHTYAMQPLVFKSLNANGNTDYFDGLTPDILVGENYGNLGILGSPDETLLAAALQHISGLGRTAYPTPTLIELDHPKASEPGYYDMFSSKSVLR
ncbi:MAG: hypothetical protein BM564_09580 [Bacteroidetes bacterium MedPE-SWsnd-G2]|nr:MAG: hypothetical protein BM564_09580 [Bacteroidetes bacterium MedPE-SWsnd-G2]